MPQIHRWRAPAIVNPADGLKTRNAGLLSISAIQVMEDASTSGFTKLWDGGYISPAYYAGSRPWATLPV
jgi:hypothetical protein